MERQFLFFDDKNILSRTGVERKLGKPEIAAFYEDPSAHTSTGLPSVWYDEKNRLYHMFYNGYVGDNIVPLAAVSQDGIHFEPRNTASELHFDHLFAPNQLLDCWGGEMAYVYEDKTAPEEERLKLLMTMGDTTAVRIMHNFLYTSGDGIHWTKQPQEWHNHAAEPCAMCFYNHVTKKHTIVARPDAGARRVGEIETEDFKTFTDLKLVMTPDSLDEPLAEYYGMPVFPYGDLFVGFLYIYHVPNERTRKGIDGKVDAQLVYSYNGTHFNRSLREPFFANDRPENAGIVFPSDLYRGAKGELLVCASVNPYEHSHFKNSGCTAIYRLREDGFICFHADGEGEVVTIPMVYGGGDITVNVNCEKFSCALFTDTSEEEAPKWTWLYQLRPLEGFGHEQFNTFSGDSTRHTLSWRGADPESLKGKVIHLEIRMKKGDLYAVNGDLTPMQICDLARYHIYGILPDLTGIG